MPWGELVAAGGGTAGALPAAVGGEHVRERRHAVVVGGVLLVVHHQEPLRPGADRLGNCADRRADVALGGIRLRTGALGLVREDPGGAAASPRLGGRRGPGTADADEQPAVRALQRLLGPVL